MTTATKDRQTVTGSAHARWADLGEAATEMERDPRYERDNTFRQEALAARVDAGRFVEEHFDELLAEKAAEAVALHEALERAEAACQESSTPETRGTLADARAACSRMAQPAAWRYLSESPRGRKIKRDDPGWSVHESRVLGQASQAAFAHKFGTDRFGHGNTPPAPRQVPMPTEFARHLGLLKPILH